MTPIMETPSDLNRDAATQLCAVAEHLRRLLAWEEPAAAELDWGGAEVLQERYADWVQTFRVFAARVRDVQSVCHASDRENLDRVFDRLAVC